MIKADNSLKVLMIEDSENDALLIRHELKRGGLTIEATRLDSLAALEAALEDGSWDLILSDYGMPGFTGHEALELVKSRGLDIPFIVISGIIGEEVAVAMMRDGAHDYLMKDNIIRLVPAVERELLEARRRRERRQAVAAMVQTERMMLTVFENTGTAMLVIEPDTTISLANRKCAELSGYDIKEIIGASWRYFVHPDDMGMMLRFHEKRRNAPDAAPNSYEFRFLNREGKYISVHITVELLQDTGQSIVSLLDISRLKESEERFHRIASSIQDAIVMMNDKGLISYWNRAAEKIFGYGRDQALGRSVSTLLVPEKLQRVFRACCLKLQRTGTGDANGKILELLALNKEREEFPIELSLSSVEIEGGLHAIGVIRDVSERRQAAQEQKKLAAEVRKTQKMEAIATLAGGIAHDFNNILGGIMGYNQLAIELEQDPQIKDFLAEVHKASLRAKELVAQILTFSKEEEQENKPILLRPVLKEVMKLLRASVPAEIDIQVDIESDSVVLSDPAKMHQVVMNLCTNAYQAMQKSGGTLRVILEDVELGEDEVKTIPQLQTGPYVRLSIADTGPGIDPEILDYIFDPFFTTKERGKGTGLGLSVVQGIIRASEGHITVESVIGKGTLFHIYLPKVIVAKVEKLVKEDQVVIQGNGRILLVDDEKDLLKMGTRMLNMVGYEVTACVTSSHALQEFLAAPQRFDLALIDIAMPGMDGIALTNELKAVRSDMLIILNTGYLDRISKKEAEQLGVQAILQKPWTMTEVSTALDKAFRKN